MASAGWGDAARYFSTIPDNLEARQKIIRNGVDVIENLTRSGEYDRIVLVGHSLGSAIGLDILHQAFGRVLPDNWAASYQHGGPAATALAHLEKMSAALNDDPNDRSSATLEEDLNDFRAAQRQYAAALGTQWRTGSAPWIVSDFVTLGSPLSKANVLIARDANAFSLLTERRQVPTCPPKREEKTPPRLSFLGRVGARIPHFGAVFAPTQWTNIYFPSRAILFGDIISGPVASLFERGVRDIRLSIAGWRFRHLDYWRLPSGSQPPEWIVALRKAVNLRMRHDLSLWNGLHGTPAGSVTAQANLSPLSAPSAAKIADARDGTP